MTKKLQNIYVFIVILFPLLFMYSTPIDGVTIADVLLLIFSVLVFVSMLFNNINFDKKIFVFGLFIVLNTILFNVIKNDNSILLRSLRYAFYIFSISLFPSASDSYKLGRKILINTSLIASIYLFLQVFCIHFLDFYLPGVLTFLKLTDIDLYNYSSVIHAAEVKRCFAFFSEPSHFAIYVLPSILLLLKEDKVLKMKNLSYSLIITFAIVLSTSITGVMFAGFIWLVWLFTNFNYNKKLIKRLIIISVPFCILVLFKTDAIKYVTNIDVLLKQGFGRLEGFVYIAQNFDNSLFTIMFGQGMNDIGELTYLSGFPRLYFYYGITGLILFLLIMFKYLINNKSDAKYIIILILLLSIGTEMIFGCFFLPYMFIAISMNDNNKKESKGLMHEEEIINEKINYNTHTISTN